MYQPATVQLLLIGEAPPAALDRYFYLEQVREQDSLFRHVVRALLGVEPARENKAALLRQLTDRGVFLIDLKPDPKTPGEMLGKFVPDLVARAVALAPAHVITIKANVCDLVQQPLRAAGLDVADARVPFPASGQQRRFLSSMGTALDQVGWDRRASL
jgi:hypothetical protein